MAKKPFLKRGSGTAGGLAAPQKQSKPPIPSKTEGKPTQETTKTETFRNPGHSSRLNRESMDEFEQIEQACSGNVARNEQEQRQMASPGRGVQNRSGAPG